MSRQLLGTAEHKWGGKFTQISCKVKDENQLLSLSKGKPATVRGIVDDDQLLGVITINDCEVIG